MHGGLGRVEECDANEPPPCGEDQAMNSTRRTIGIAVLTLVAVLGTGWILEQAFSNSQRPSAESTRAIDAAPVTSAPATDSAPARPAPTDSFPEYDRSD